MKHPSTLLLTSLALLAFAANSVLCRAALADQAIDALSFTSIRILSGAAMLMLLCRFRPAFGAGALSGLKAAAALFVYALFFSVAYGSLSTGTGALVLFGSVQLTMLLVALVRGERMRMLGYVGLLLALAGLVVLVFPGLSAPSLAGVTLMALAGIAWGMYSLLGRGSKAPIADTAGSFVLAAPAALAINLAFLPQASASKSGVLLAVASGAVTSGVGYAIWYAALRGLTRARAAAVQLLVPVIAALGGVAFLTEVVTVRLVVASLMVLGGVGLVLMVKNKATP